MLRRSGTFWRIVKQRSTEEFESLPYVCTLLNSCLWTYYGIIKSGEILVATVNGFGAVVEVVYVTLFIVYAPPRFRVSTLISTFLSFFLEFSFRPPTADRRLPRMTCNNYRLKQWLW